MNDDLVPNKKAKKKNKKKHQATVPAEIDYAWLIRFYRVFARHYSRHWAEIAFALFGLLMTVGIALLTPWPLKLIIDLVLGRPFPEEIAPLVRLLGTDPSAMLLVLAGCFVVLRVVDSIFSYVHKVGLKSVAEKMTTEIRERLFSHLQRLSLSFHDKSRAGDLMVRFVSDLSDIKTVLVEMPENFIYRITMIASHVGLMMMLDWRLALIALSVIPILGYVNRRMGKQVQDASTKKRSKEGDVASTITESVTAMALIQAYGREDLQQAQFDSQNRESLASGLRAMRLSKAFKRVSDILVAVATCGVVYAGGRLALEGAIPASTLVLFAAYLRNLYGPLDKFTSMMLDVAVAQAAGKRLVELLESDSVVTDDPRALVAPRFHGRVAFDRVGFGYRKGLDILDELSFAVEPGQTVAVIGHNGAGKSTVISLLLRFYDPQRGRIMVDGRDIREYSLRSLRSHITVVMQEAKLFNQSIRDNIAFGKHGATGEDVERAARLAQVHDFVARMPHGYDEVIFQGGENLSGGERQRLNIARAIIRDTPIVILDEPMTSLDARNEALVQEALDHLTRGRTTFIVAHKLSTVARADRILLLERGALAAFGTHDELLARSPEYRELVRLQTDGAWVEDRGPEATPIDDAPAIPNAREACDA